MTTSPTSSTPEPVPDSGVSSRGNTAAIQITRVDGLLALIVGGLALLVYGRTVVPGLLPGDGGEFQTLTYLLGSTHPTGYPVYLVLARLFSLIPTGDLAYRVNLFSAVMGAVAISGVYLCGRLLTGYRATAAVGALALAVSTTLWSQALIAEVYTAGAAFLVFILLALLYWDASDANWALFTAGLLGGLSIGIHLSVALLAPAILLYLLLHWRRGCRMWKTAVFGALSGLAITVAIFMIIEWNDPTASYFNSVVEPSRSAWGYDAGQMDGPFEHLLFGWQGRQFQYLMFANMAKVMPVQAAGFLAKLKNELASPLILLAAVGAVGLLLRRLRAALLLLSALLLQLAFFFNYEIWDLYVFYIPSYLLLTLLAIAGMGIVIVLLDWGIGQLTAKQFKSAAALDVIIAVAALLLFIWPIFQPRYQGVVAGEVSFDFEQYPEYRHELQLTAAATVVDLPQNAIVFTDWDMMWPYYYAAHLEGDRPDTRFIETFPADNEDMAAASLLEYVRHNLGKRPMFFEDRLQQLAEIEGITLAPVRVGPTRFFSVIENP